MDAKKVDTIFTAKHRALIKAIRRIRIGKGLRQIDVARRMHVSVAWVLRLESGQRRLDVVEYWLLAQAIGFDAAKLMRQVFTRKNHKSQ